MIRYLMVVVLVFVFGCSVQVAPAPGDDCELPEEPNGFCEVDDECAETDFCLLEWCDAECRPWERCIPRLLEGDGCQTSRQCSEGLVCGKSTEFDQLGECIVPATATGNPTPTPGEKG